MSAEIKDFGSKICISAENVRNFDQNFKRGVFVSNSCQKQKVSSISTKMKPIFQLWFSCEEETYEVRSGRKSICDVASCPKSYKKKKKKFHMS